MTIDQLAAVVQELTELVQNTEFEVHALRQLLAESGHVTEAAIRERIEVLRGQRIEDLEAELRRRAFEKIAASGPTH